MPGRLTARSNNFSGVSKLGFINARLPRARLIICNTTQNSGLSSTIKVYIFLYKVLVIY